MLEIIGQVYVEQGRFDQSQATAGCGHRALHDRSAPSFPAYLLKPLLDRAYLDWRGRSPANAESYLVEAESLVAGDEQQIEVWVRAVMDRAWVASILRDHKRSIEILEPMYERIRDRTDIKPRHDVPCYRAPLQRPPVNSAISRFLPGCERNPNPF